MNIDDQKHGARHRLLPRTSLFIRSIYINVVSELKVIRFSCIPVLSKSVVQMKQHLLY